ncbi:olfactory receptor 1052-like [Sphaerodactylus townsendi]|uniref:olfactory receptor 1052-like n=1 Tax=Sphaerodactylus townsendi TaxID=933632 RepID=UPI0020267CBD|nr:olfactory receptor 1052-like [Sphaerodactylus townsendi]
MAVKNYTMVTEFILLGLTDQPVLQVPLFVLFLIIYVLTLAGNMGMIVLIRISPQLHTPMYFFLSNLSLVDICYSSIFAPRLLMNFAQSKTISFAACITQHWFFVVFVTTEGFLLAAMAYDRYVAICNPLLYTAVITKRICIYLLGGSYLGGVLNSFTHTSGLLILSFCVPNTVNHFFCDTPAMLQVACSDIHINELLLVIFSGVIALSTFLIIIISYIFILTTILKIHSSENRYKAFSTCASHLTAVTLFYGPVSLSHLQPSSMYSQEQEKVSAVFYTLVVPMLNPLIYSLRNKEVKDAFKRLAKSEIFFKSFIIEPQDYPEPFSVLEVRKSFWNSSIMHREGPFA